MLTLEKINSRFSNDIGMMFRVQRLLREFTLRDLAEHSSLSHTLLNKIELGLTPITKHNLLKLSEALNIDVQDDTIKNQNFLNLKNKIYEKIIYPDPPKIMELFREMNLEESYYLTSICAVDYMILYIAIYNRPYHKRMDQVQTYVNIICSLSRQLSSEQHANFLVYRGIFHFYSGNYDSACEDLLSALDENENSQLKAVISYYLGRSLSDNYQLSKANHYYELSEQLCHQSHNTKRLPHVLFFKAINQLKKGEYSVINEKLQTLVSEAKTQNQSQLTIYLYRYQVISEILKGNYEEAKSKIRTIVYKDAQHYFYQALLAFKGQYVELMKDSIEYLHENENEKPLFINGIKALEGLMFPDQFNEATQEKRLTLFFEKAVHYTAFIETNIAYEYLREFLIDKRKYKQAYTITEKMIAIYHKSIE